MNTVKDELRVLVVGDERLAREAAAGLLQQSGFIAQSSAGGPDALARLAAERFDVVVTELRAPHDRGMELVRVLKRQWPSIDVVVTTAYGSAETAAAAISEGASDYLVKPFAFRELEHRLRKLGELRRVRQELESLRSSVHGGEARPAGAVAEPLAKAPTDGSSGRARLDCHDGFTELVTLHLDHRERLPFQRMVRCFEDTLIQWAMRRTGGQQSSAAELLGLPRTTLQSKLGRLASDPAPAADGEQIPRPSSDEPS